MGLGKRGRQLLEGVATSLNRDPQSLNRLGPGKMTIDVTINGASTSAMIDSGAAADFLSESYAQDWVLVLNEKEHPYPLVTADGTAIGSNQGMVKYETTVTMEVLGQVCKRTFDVTNIGDTDIILGLPWLQDTKPHIDWSTLNLSLPRDRYPARFGKRIDEQTISLLRKSLRNVEVVAVCLLQNGEKPAFQIPPEYKEFRELFTEEAPEDALPPHQPWDHEITLKEGTQVKTFGIYPLRQDQREELDKYVTDFLAKGFIEESKSPAGYPVFYVPKPDGGLRLCVDYRHLNSITVKNGTTLPLIQELRDRLLGMRYFTKFDIPAAFHRIRIKKGDEYKTAFRTHRGHYHYKVMPFGLTNAPATMQAYMNSVLREHLDKYVVVYMDDILVYSRTLEQHIEHVRMVLKALKKYNLRLKPSKSEFHKQRIEFVGIIVSYNGLEVNPDKVARVTEWKEPTTIKEVQEFLGFVNYYRQFIKGYSKIAVPLTELTKKTEEFIWSGAAQKAFDELKTLLTTTPILQLFDHAKPTTVETDASKYALGAVLSQPGPDGKLRPIAYHSRKFNPAETRYSTSDQELLAIVDSLKHWRYYLEGTKESILVLTDHMAIRTFTTTKVLNGRQLRWSHELSSFNFHIKHRSGKLNANADALSRRADYRDKEKIEVQHTLFKEENGRLVHQVAVLEKIDIPDQERIRTEQAKRTDWEIKDKDGGDVSNRHGIYRFKGLVILPPSLEKEWTLRFHEPPLQGHARPEVVLERLQRNYYFPKMRQKVFQWIGKCNQCRKAKYERHKPYGHLQPNTAPEKSWQIVSMDFVGPLPMSKDLNNVEYENIMVVVCRLTKYVIFIPLPRKYDASYLAKVFTREVISKFGVPEQIISDRDKLFTSHFWEELCQMLQIKRAMSTSYHPQTDGQTERMNQTMEQYLRLYVNDDQDDWASLLPQAALAYNATKQTTIGMSPYYANFGKEPRLSVDQEDYCPTEATLFADNLQSLHEQLRSDVEFLNKRMAWRANQKRSEGPDLKEGDKVYLWRRNMRTKRQSTKLDFLKLGPFKIKAVKGPVNYELQLPSHMRIHPVFHISLLEKADAETPLDHETQLDDAIIEQEYEVETILDHTTNKNQHLYFVKWKGYPEEESSWIPYRDFNGWTDLLNYHRQNPEHSAPPGVRRILNPASPATATTQRQTSQAGSVRQSHRVKKPRR